MLVVKSDVPGEQVEDAVVRISLWDRSLENSIWASGRGSGVLGRGQVAEDVVFGDKVTGAWVKRSGEERGEDEVEEGVPAAGLDQYRVENNLDKDVEEVDLGDIHGVNHHWAKSVEENLEGAKECLSKDGVEEDNFQCGRKVDVETVNAQRLVVCQMVWAERGRVWNADWKVNEDGEHSVGEWRAEGEVMGDFVDGQETVLVGCCADNIGCEEECP